MAQNCGLLIDHSTSISRTYDCLAGSVEFEQLERRQAVLAWRDQLMLGIWRTFNAAGIEARQRLEPHLADAGFIETLRSPGEFTRDKVDSVMRAAARRELETLFGQAAKDLRVIDPRYDALAEALVQSLAILRYPLPVVKAEAATTEVPAPHPIEGGYSRLGAMMEVIANQELARSAREWGSWALEIVGEASDVARQRIQSGVGMHDRLRESARLRIDIAWMATAGDPMPILGQLIAVIESVSNEARSMAL